MICMAFLQKIKCRVAQAYSINNHIQVCPFFSVCLNIVLGHGHWLEASSQLGSGFFAAEFEVGLLELLCSFAFGVRAVLQRCGGWGCFTLVQHRARSPTFCESSLVMPMIDSNLEWSDGIFEWRCKQLGLVICVEAVVYFVLLGI